MKQQKEQLIPKNVPKSIPVYDEIDEYDDIDFQKEVDFDHLYTREEFDW